MNECKVIDKLWGNEKIIASFVDGQSGYTGKVLTVEPNGNACSMHYHAIKTETFYVIEGVLELQIWDNPISMRKIFGSKVNVGDSITIQKNQPHRFWATKNRAVFVEVSTPDNPEDSIRMKPSGPLSEEDDV